jgi:hypothetical protein
MIIDQAVDINIFNRLRIQLNMENHLCDIPFYFLNTTARKEENRPVIDSSWFHLLFEFDKSCSNNFYVCNEAFNNALQKTDQKLTKLIRMRLGLITAQKEYYEHAAHVDFTYPHKTALLYLNDSDGDTIFYNKFYDPMMNPNNVLSSLDYYNSHIKDSGIKPVKSVSPKENRFFTFDGLQYHSSTTPKNHTYRLVININYLVEGM